MKKLPSGEPDLIKFKTLCIDLYHEPETNTYLSAIRNDVVRVFISEKSVEPNLALFKALMFLTQNPNPQPPEKRENQVFPQPVPSWFKPQLPSTEQGGAA